jgi:hypothetical protein
VIREGTRVQVSEDLLVPAEVQLDVGVVKLGLAAHFQQPLRLGGDLGRGRQPGQRRITPAAERLLQQASRAARIAQAALLACLLHQCPEPQQVQAAGSHVPPVRAGERGQPASHPGDLAGAADRHPQGRVRVRRLRLAPQDTGQQVPAARPPGEQQQHGQQLSFPPLGPAEQLAAVGPDLERTENPELHASPRLSRPRWLPAAPRRRRGAAR